MKKFDFVRTKTRQDASVWRVIEVSDNRVTAEERPNELEPSIVRRISAPPNFFISLEEQED